MVDWKNQLQEEQEVSEDIRVFVIVNEWTDIANDTSSELVGGKWFATEDEAWDALDVIAESYDYDLGSDETSIQLEEHSANLQNEEYRIEELTRG